jgi:hypothetical protein
VGTVTQGFKKSAERVEALDVITSTKANSLRKRAYQEVNAKDADPANAAAYGDVFERLAAHRTDKPTTSKYLKNAAIEFHNHQRILEARPVVEKALRRAAAESEEWKGVVDFGQKIQTMSSFGSPNTPVGFAVALHLANVSHAPQYYAEKLAELLATDGALAPYRDLINTLVIFGYGSYKLPADPRKGNLEPARIEGGLAVEGAPGKMNEVLKNVERRGRLLLREADSLFYPVYFKHFETFPSVEAVDRYKAGLERLLPLANHTMTRSVVKDAIRESGVIRTALGATKVVADLLADPKRNGRFAKLLDPNRPVEPLSSGARVWIKPGKTWQEREAIGKEILEMANAVPGFPAGDLRIDVRD